MSARKYATACAAVVEALEARALFSATYVLDGVQPAAYDQPRIHALFKTTPTGTPLTADDGEGDTSFDITGFLDTGSSGIVISQETGEALGFQASTFGGKTVVYNDVGVAGTQEFNVSQALYLNLAPYYDSLNGDGADTTNPAVFNQSFGPLRTQMTEQPVDDDGFSDPLDIFGMPAMQGKVVVMDTTPVNDLDFMRTWLYNPGTTFHSTTTTTDPGIPSTNLHVKLGYASLQRYTEVLPAGAPGPVFTSNPFIGPAPGVAGDTTPPLGISLGGLSASGSFLLDTGAQSSFMSTAMAAKIHVHYMAGTQDSDNPILVDTNNKEIPDQFQIPIGGIGGTTTAAGFYLDSLTLPTQEGTPIKFTHAPVLVLDVTVQDPKNGQTLTLDGDLGMNYFVASSAIAGGVGDDHPGDFTWMTFDQPKGVLGLQLPGAVPVTTGSVAGTVFNDANANGKLDTGEKGLASVRVYLDANKNGKFDAGEVSSLADASGNYKFTGLNAGTYRVRESIPAGYAAGTPSSAYFDLVVAAGQDIAGKNFADTPIRAAITGTVYNDASADGTRQAGEVGLKGWRVYVDANNNGKFDATEASALTDAVGNYTLPNLLPGSHTVRDVVSAGYRQTTVTNYVVSLAGVTATARNFGATTKAKLSGNVFLDANKNKIQDKTEAGLANWRVYVDANKNGKFDAGETSVLTTSTGAWTLNLNAGTYVIRAVQQTGFTLTTPASGSYTVTLAAAVNSAGKVFGETK